MQIETKKRAYFKDWFKRKLIPLSSEVMFQACNYKIESIKVKHAYTVLNSIVLSCNKGAKKFGGREKSTLELSALKKP